jgi:hypothetical protein
MQNTIENWFEVHQIARSIIHGRSTVETGPRVIHECPSWSAEDVSVIDHPDYKTASPITIVDTRVLITDAGTNEYSLTCTCVTGPFINRQAADELTEIANATEETVRQKIKNWHADRISRIS